MNKEKNMYANIRYTPKELYNKLNSVVIGQDDYLKKLSNSIWLHQQRTILKRNYADISRMPKSNLLVVGPSGSGKTLAITELAKLLGLDVGIFNAAEITGPGWKGKDYSDVIKELYLLCNSNVGRTENAIVVLDEVDKMLLQGTSTKDSFCAENSLLKLIEGMDVTFPNNEMNITINTSNILFIASGAFEGIEKYLVFNSKNIIGFRPETLSDEKGFSHTILKDALVSYGVGVQFLGRFYDIAQLNPLSVEALEDILHKSEASIIKTLNTMLGPTNNIDINITPKASNVVAKQALDLGTGARGLTKIVMSNLQNTFFEITNNDTVKEICIDVDTKDNLCINVKENTNKLKRKIEPINNYVPNANHVELLADEILSSYPSKIDSFRELRAAHSLLCSAIFFVLMECPECDQTLTGIKKLINAAEEDKKGNSVFEYLITGFAMDFNFYFDQYKELDPVGKSIGLIKEALNNYTNVFDKSIKEVIFSRIA